MNASGPPPRIAVLLPCYDEEGTIAHVVREFRSTLSGATVYVYDNNSRDATVERARAAGAVVRREPRQGKRHVLRRMFADIEADVYVLADGDATYDAASAPVLIARLVGERLDMVVGARRAEDAGAAYRHGHRFGNRLLTGMIGLLSGRSFNDILSGYRVFSRRFVKSFPALAAGFETETELTVHVLALRMPIAEMETPYRARPVGSESKLSTCRDGLRILLTIISLFKEERPLAFFTALFALLFGTALALAYPIVVTWLETGLVPRFPTAILATGITVLAFLSLASGVILDTVTRARREFRRLAYLAIPPVGETRGGA